MKLLPLSAKKKLSRFMGWFDYGAVVTVAIAALAGGFGGVLFYQDKGGPGEAKEKIVLQEKVTHLMQSYKMSQSLHIMIDAAGAGMKAGLDLPAAQAADKSLTQAFDAEAQATGIALAHARQISDSDRYRLYKQLDAIEPAPDYFKKAGGDPEAFLLTSFAQSKVMDRPGFTPTLDTAREIIKGTKYGAPLETAGIFGPLLLSLGGIFGFCAARKRLDRSIANDETALRRAEEAAKLAEAARQVEEAQREAAAAAERERIAKLPIVVSTTLDRDISVRQIRLAAKEPSPGV